MMKSVGRRNAWVQRSLVALALVSFAGGVSAKAVPESEQIDRTEPLPARLVGVDVKEHLNEPVDRSTSFVDENGQAVTLGNYFDGTHPVILTLNYSRCPMLCGLELNALVTTLKQLPWTIGKEFKVVTVVLDPKETPAQAKEAKGRYLRQYGRGADDGWHFLTGSDANIHAVASSVGFSYGYNEERNEYIHPAAIMIVTPSGRLARYLYGIEYLPKTVRLSLAEASEGKIGTTIDQLILYCFHYDAKEGHYTPVVMNIMRVGGGATATALGGYLAFYFASESRRRKQKPTPSAGEGSLRSSQI